MIIAARDVKLTATVYRREDWARIAPTWSELAGESNASVFLSPEWVGIWLETFGKALDAAILVFEDGSEIIGGCLLSRRCVGLPFIPLRRLSLNAAGERASETTYVEYNNLLCRPGSELATAAALVNYLKDQPWEELALDGFVDGPAYHAICDAFPETERIVRRHPSYYVDLRAIRNARQRYESVLQSRHRKHLRQNIRYHSESGDLEFKSAADVATGLSMLHELAVFNEERRVKLGRRTVFSSERFVVFHEQLVARYLESGLVQLLRLTSGGQPIGIIYNLVHRGRAYFYQCGYRYTSNRRLSPGTVTLAFAIQHCLDLGIDDYDFLSGEAKYKEWMSTSARELVWTVLSRRTARTALVARLRKVRDRLRER